MNGESTAVSTWGTSMRVQSNVGPASTRSPFLRNASQRSAHLPEIPLSVLIVDDDDDTLEALGVAFQELEHRVTLATGGRNAQRLLMTTSFDVILSDWRMPEVSGVDLCRLVRAADREHYTYFIFLTCLSDQEHLIEGMRAGADDFLAKPCSLQEIEVRLAAAGRVLGLHKRLEEQNTSLRNDCERHFNNARIDALTQAGNRLGLDEHLETISDIGRNYGYSIAMIDVDHFKAYNDAYGHLEGDRVLRRLADIAREQLRRNDALYRYGGEEFAILLGGQRLDQASISMNRVREAVERLQIPHPDGVLTISAGVAERSDLVSNDDWIVSADRALYRAKSLGRNRVELALP